MSDIKPIQTRYKGYNFRSRLEARWAVFFDALGLDWEYEPEGFDLGELGWYLPDFCITSPYGGMYYYEIKPASDVFGGDKINALQNIFTEYYNEIIDDPNTADSKPIIREATLLCGDPYYMVSRSKDLYSDCFVICPRCGSIHPDEDYCFACDMQTESGRHNPQYESVLFSGIKYTPDVGYIEITDFMSKTRYQSLIMDAAQSARSARFEYGQSGAT